MIMADRQMMMLQLKQAAMLKKGAGAITDGFWKSVRPQDPQGKALSALLNERKQGR